MLLRLGSHVRWALEVNTAKNRDASNTKVREKCSLICPQDEVEISHQQVTNLPQHPQRAGGAAKGENRVGHGPPWRSECTWAWLEQSSRWDHVWRMLVPRTCDFSSQLLTWAFPHPKPLLNNKNAIDETNSWAVTVYGGFPKVIGPLYDIIKVIKMDYTLW